MRILFKCKGNICRSPAAEAYLRAQRPDWFVCSVATTQNTKGMVFDYRMRAACEAQGIKTHKRPVQWQGSRNISGVFDHVFDLHLLGIQDPYLTLNFDEALKEIIYFVDTHVVPKAGENNHESR